MILQEVENQVLNIIDRAVKELSEADAKAFLETVHNYVMEKSDEFDAE